MALAPSRALGRSGKEGVKTPDFPNETEKIPDIGYDLYGPLRHEMVCTITPKNAQFDPDSYYWEYDFDLSSASVAINTYGDYLQENIQRQALDITQKGVRNKLDFMTDLDDASFGLFPSPGESDVNKVIATEIVETALGSVGTLVDFGISAAKVLNKMGTAGVQSGYGVHLDLEYSNFYFNNKKKRTARALQLTVGKEGDGFDDPPEEETMSVTSEMDVLQGNPAKVDYDVKMGFGTEPGISKFSSTEPVTPEGTV